MSLLLIGLLLFFGVHSISILVPGWRDAMVARIGERPWRGVYSLLSLAGLALLIHGYGAARMDPVALYNPAPWLRHLTFTLMLPVFPLLLATFLPGRIKTATKHPSVLAVTLWALSHLLANGMLADVLLFGAFVLWAAATRISYARRPAPSVPTLPASRANDAIAVIGGLAIYVGLVLWLHPLLIGIALIVR
jgi:uncharacterized membrane protein